MSGLAELIGLQARSPILARRLFRFNFCPADYLHPSRRIHFDGEMLDDRVWQSHRSRAPLSSHILQTLGLENQVSFDISQPEWPLLLLEPIQLKRLQRHLAAAVFNPVIRHTVLHDEVMMWRDRLGVDAYKFALNGFKLLPRGAWAQADFNVGQLESITFGLIEAAMSTAAAPSRLRAVLKLPNTSAPPQIDVECARRLVYALMSILEPEWRSYFRVVQQ